MSDHVDVTCAECGVAFCLPRNFQRELCEEHGTFYCPNGHSLNYPAKTAKEKRIEQLEHVVQVERRRIAIRDDRIARLETEVRSLRSRLAWARRRRRHAEAEAA